MKFKNIVLPLILVTAFVLTACGGAAKPDAMMDKPTEEAMMEKPTEEPMMDTPTEEAMMDKSTPDAMAKPTDAAMMDSPAWFSAALTDARTGQVFTINDFKGKVVLVETLAMWCSNCKRQQGQVVALHALLGERDDFASLGLDIDPNENANALKSYVESNGFDWLYAVAPAEVSREIASLYGDQFLNPPSTPMLVIDRRGVAHPLPFGIKSAEELLNFLQPFFDESM